MHGRPLIYTETVGTLLGDINRMARRQFDRRVRDLQLTRAQWLTLYHVARQPGCTQSELAAHLEVEPICVSRQAARLERAGWIERRQNRRDARAYQLFLTPKAVRIVEQLARLAAELREEYLDGLSSRHRASLVQMLSHVKSNLLRLEHRAMNSSLA